MALDNQGLFELLVTVRYDVRLLQVSRQNAAIYNAVRNVPYPPQVLPAEMSDDSTDGSALYLPHLHQKRLVDGARHFGWREALVKLTQAGQPLSSPGNFNGWVSKQLKAQANMPPTDIALRLRILLAQSGSLSLQAFTTPPINFEEVFFPPDLADPESMLHVASSAAADGMDAWRRHATWTIFLDNKATSDLQGGGREDHLRLKTTCRLDYDTARKRLPELKATSSASEIAAGTMEEVLLFNNDGLVVDGSITSAYFWREQTWVTPSITTPTKVGAQAGTTRSFALASGLCKEGDIHRDSLQAGEVVWLSNGVRGFGWGVLC